MNSLRVAALFALASVIGVAGSSQAQSQAAIDGVPIEALPHASYAREILKACPMQVHITPDRRSLYDAALKAFDGLKRSRPSDFRRWSEMAKARAVAHSCGEFEQMMRTPKTSPNMFLLSR